MFLKILWYLINTYITRGLRVTLVTLLRLVFRRKFSKDKYYVLFTYRNLHCDVTLQLFCLVKCLFFYLLLQRIRLQFFSSGRLRFPSFDLTDFNPIFVEFCKIKMWQILILNFCFYKKLNTYWAKQLLNCLDVLKVFFYFRFNFEQLYILQNVSVENNYF